MDVCCCYAMRLHGLGKEVCYAMRLHGLGKEVVVVCMMDDGRSSRVFVVVWYSQK
jgi:hypothetical protein